MVALLVSLGSLACVVTNVTPVGPSDAGAPAPEPDAAPSAPVDAGSGCDAPIVAPVAALGLATSYAKYLDAEGIPVVSSAKVSDAALRASCRIVKKMVSFRADVRDAMKARAARVAVMARTEKTTDVPEHADLYTAFPGTDWNERARGLGGTVARPATSCAEENLLCEKEDRYRGENILVHELAHGMVNLGVVFADKTFKGASTPRSRRPPPLESGATPTPAPTRRSTSRRASSPTSTRTSSALRPTGSTTR